MRAARVEGPIEGDALDAARMTRARVSPGRMHDGRNTSRRRRFFATRGPQLSVWPSAAKPMIRQPFPRLTMPVMLMTLSYSVMPFCAQAVRSDS